METTTIDPDDYTETVRSIVTVDPYEVRVSKDDEDQYLIECADVTREETPYSCKGGLLIIDGNQLCMGKSSEFELYPDDDVTFVLTEGGKIHLET